MCFVLWMLLGVRAVRGVLENTVRVNFHVKLLRVLPEKLCI